MTKKRQPHRDARDSRRDHQTWTDREKDFEARPLRVGFGWAAKVTFGVIALVLCVVAVVWLFNLGTSDVKGRGNAVRQKNDATNRIQQQERFEDLAADFAAFPTKIQAAEHAVERAQASKDPTDDSLRETDLAGLTQQCIDIARDYNAMARKYTARDFRAEDLPAKLDTEECKA